MKLKLELDFKIDKTEIQIFKDGKPVEISELEVGDVRTFLHRLPEVRLDFERRYRQMV